MRPLKTLELRHALAVEIGKPELDKENLPEIEDMVSVCTGLVTVDEESDIVRLVHYTTQGYFERMQRDWFPDAQKDIATTCVTYLSIDIFETGFCWTDTQFEARLQLNPFYDYAARNWGHHTRKASTEVEQLIMNFLESEAKASASSQAMMASRLYSGDSDYSQRAPRQMAGVHLAAYFGLREAVIALLENRYNLNLRDTHGRTPLSWAAANGHETVVELLLATDGVDPDSKDSYYGRTPLLWAAGNGHEAAVQLLLATDGVDPNSKDSRSWTPLLWAAGNGHEAVVQLLLAQDGVDPDFKDKGGQTPLSSAAWNGHEAVVKLLLATDDVDPDYKDSYHSQTPLSFAALNGHEAVVRLLLATDGVDPNSGDSHSRTPLSWAAADGREAVVQLLLATDGVDPDSKDSHSRTTLLWAAGNGHETVVKLLLATDGVDRDSKDSNYGRTPLSWAAGNGHEAVVRLLLATDGVDPNSEDSRSWTPLLWAAGNGHEAVVQLLLATNGVDSDHPLASRFPSHQINPSGQLIHTTTTFPSMTPKPDARRKSSSKPKARTGCTTCKIWRIKCDETKPSCLRCTSTGRTCDGYKFTREQISLPGTTALSPPRNPSVTWSQQFLPSSISATFPGDTQERLIFHRFQVCTVPAFAGGSESGFWDSLLLKAGQQEPVVRNAIVALGTLHEDYQTREGKFNYQLSEEPSYQHALRLYAKALRQLNSHLHEGSTHGAKLAIISSILFCCFEVLRRNNMAAVIHYQAGMMELIRQMNLTKAAAMSPRGSSLPALQPIPQSELDELLRVFARYDIQACTFLEEHTNCLDFNLPRALPTSLTLPEVRIHLDNLLISLYQLVKSNLGMYRYWKREMVPMNWLIQREEATMTFEAWLNAFEKFFHQSKVVLRPSDIKSLLGQRLQIRVAIIMLKTCIDCGPESSFDIFEDEFEDMIIQVEKVGDALSLREGRPLDSEATPFTMDLGIIHPLFFITNKCRNWSLRRRAIVELRRAGREGLWEGPIMAVVAERIMQIEEAGVPWGEVIPERNRLHEIRKNVAYETRRVYVEASRARDDTWKNWDPLQEVVPF